MQVFFNYIQGLGASVLMPIIIAVFAMIFGIKFGRALRSGLMVGVGFIGLNLVIGLLQESLGPAVQAMIKNYNLNLSIIDVGWPSAATIALASKVGLLIIPIGLAVNIFMLTTKTTQTINIDIWNYWHFAFTGSLVAIVTGKLYLGILAAIFNLIIVMVLADYTAKGVEETLGMPGVSIPHGFAAAYVPIAWIANKIFDRIPKIKDIDINLDSIQSKFGFFSEPILMGTVIGIVIGIIAGYDSQHVLQLGVSMGAVLVLIPKMAALLMEGLLPISDASSEFIKKKFGNSGKIYIGLDAAVGVGHPVTLSLSLILVPLTILIAIILPGNKVLPFADLAVIPFMFVLIVTMVRGNAFRAFIIGIIVISVGLLIATFLAPFITTSAIAANFKMPENATLISSICDGANPLTWLVVFLNKITEFGVYIVGVIAVVMMYFNRKRIKKEAGRE